MRARIVSFTAVILAMFAAVIVFAAPSQAAFSVSCNLNAVAQGRLDFPAGIEYTANHTHIDTSAIRYRSINRDTGAVATWKADAVWVQLYNGVTGVWDKWTYIGGTATDSSKVGPDYTWDPAAKSSPGTSEWDQMRGRIWFNGYFCNMAPTITF